MGREAYHLEGLARRAVEHKSREILTVAHKKDWGYIEVIKQDENHLDLQFHILVEVAG